MSFSSRIFFILLYPIVSFLFCSFMIVVVFLWPFAALIRQIQMRRHHHAYKYTA